MGPRLHWFPEGVRVEALAEVLVGMANAQGGTVLLGVSPRGGHVQGVDDVPAALDTVFQAALRADPPLVLPMPQSEQVAGGTLLVIQVPRGLPHVYSLDGRYLIRRGRRTVPLPARDLHRLLVERGEVLFESRVPPEATLDDLDEDAVADYLERLHLPLPETPHQVLLRRGCLRQEGGQLRPTYAALLLFGRHPQRWLPNAGVLAARFPDVVMADAFLKQEIGGTLPEQIRQAEAFVRQNVPQRAQLVGLERRETPAFPPEAVRELLVNAVAHRDYNLQGDNVRLLLFADRLEVHSPGGLPGPVTLDNLLEARFSRNPVIVQVLSDLGFVERLGYGLKRVLRLTRQYGLPAPRFEEVGGSFRVTLLSAETPLRVPDLSAYRDLGLNERQQRALAHLLQHGRITNREYRALNPEVHPETARRDLNDMVSRGLLVRVGDKRGTYYLLKKQP